MEETSNPAFFVPVNFLGFVTMMGKGTEEERDSLTKSLTEVRKSEEVQRKFFEISKFISERFGINFLMVPRFLEISDKNEHKDHISSFLAFLAEAEGSYEEDDEASLIPK